MVFSPHPQGKQRINSANILIKLLLTHKKQGLEVIDRHYEELLTILLGKITEAHSKSKTLYRSQCSIEEKSMLQHEHVYQRKTMIKALVNANSELDVSNILLTAVACIVTHDEHKKLSQFDYLYGWERYERAGILVMEMSGNKPKQVDLRMLIKIGQQASLSS